jgi:hypothetical protein
MKKFLKNIVKLKEISTIKDFPVRDISVNFGFGFGLHFLPTTKIFIEERFIKNVTGTDRICPGN